MTDGVIFDYKTGDPRPEDEQQIKYYALLYWLETATLPKGLILCYNKTNYKITVPIEFELKIIQSDLKRILDDLSSSISMGKPLKPKPSESNCSLCDVRQLCDTYWNMEDGSVRLRKVHNNFEHEPKSQDFLADIRVESIPETWSTGSGMFHKYHSNDLNMEIHLRLRASLCPSVGNLRPSAGLILSAQCRISEDRKTCTVSAHKNTEVFWIPE